MQPFVTRSIPLRYFPSQVVHCPKNIKARHASAASGRSDLSVVSPDGRCFRANALFPVPHARYVGAAYVGGAQLAPGAELLADDGSVPRPR